MSGRRGSGLNRVAALTAYAVLGSVMLIASAGPVAADTLVFDDFEHGDPFSNGWFSFGGTVGGGGIGANTTDLPPTDGGLFSLESGWGSGGTPGFFGGFGRGNPTDLSGTDHFNFWINPDADQDYTLEINLQDDDDGTDTADNAGPDDEFQFNCVVSPVGPCAVAGGGWQHVSIPLADFFDDNSFFTGGNGVLDPVATSAGGNGRLINAVIAVIGNSGSEVNFRTDSWVFSTGALSQPTALVDDFESGLPSGTDGNGSPIGFFTFSDGSPVSIATTDTPPAPVPGSATGNDVIALTGDVTGFAGFIHAFENDAVDTWVTQDWSSFEGLRFWFHGLNNGTTVFVDLIDNRNSGSTRDDAERFSVSFVDDFAGWQQLEFPFSSFVRKEIGNGAPNDGLTLTQVHGWALGTLNTPGEVTYHVDDVELYGEAVIPPLAVTFASANTDIGEGSTGSVSVALNRPMNSDDPAQVSVDYLTEVGSATPDRDYTPTSGTLTFVNGGPSTLDFPISTIDDTKWEGAETTIMRLANPVDVAAGFAMQARATIVENDPYDPLLLDDFERFPHTWDASDEVALSNPELASGDALARPEQDAFEGVLQIEGPRAVDIEVKGNVCAAGRAVVTVNLLSTPDFDATSVDHRTVTFGAASEVHVNRRTGVAKRHEEDANGDGLTDLVFHFRARDIGVDCGDPVPFNGATFDGDPITAGGSNATFSRTFPLGQDWTDGEALSFWYYGTGTGEDVTVHVQDNRAPDPGPSDWDLVWAEEFDEAAGTQPDPANWGYEIGDGTVNGIPGWGNDELQYYTNDPANVATDGDGNLLLTVREADGSLQCYYGPCEYTSARLVSKQKAEFAYGRVESRIRVPDGEAGLWPAFWSLGTDIDVVSWPKTGEIDFMEYVSRLPNEIFGTIHGPGYSGGQSYGNVYDFGEPAFNDYHTFAIEWEPDLIRWYVDDILYHTATPADVAPNEWVFNDPVYMLLNVAVGGNFGGAVSPDLQFPQSMAVDYIRVYQGPDTAERFEATFVDDFEGWQKVSVPFTGFVRSADQPAGAPDDGLGLSEVWGYGFTLPDGGLPDGVTWLDLVAVQPVPPPTEITVTNLDDGGEGSLREALADIAAGGTISMDPGLAGGTIDLTSGPLAPTRSATIDGSAAPGLTLDGGGTDRVLKVDAGLEVTVTDVTITNGFFEQLAGCVLNNGSLTLDRVTVTGCTMTTDAGDFWQGGGGIYNGDGATLDLIDSTVSDNTSGWTGGGVYSFFNTVTNVVRSTISGNIAADVAGGFRTLGEVNIDNSTISGNTSTTWHGGAMFITDGVVTVTNSTITGNVAPGGTAGGLFVGTFTASGATLNLQNTIVAANGDLGCFLAPFGSGPVALNSLGTNVFTDSSCSPVGSDQVVADAGLDPLTDNGGPTWTHGLQTGSPAIDAADSSVCRSTDQRGVARPQGAACDVGAYELE